MLVLWARDAFAHVGSVPVRGGYDFSDLPDADPGVWNVWWPIEWTILVGILAFLVGYALLSGPLRRRWNLSPVGPSLPDIVRFVLAMAVVLFALQGPLHELGDNYLFSAHMVQHLLITLIFPPLLITGIPAWMWKPAVQVPWVGRVGRFLTRPLVAFCIATATLYFWHVPAMYEAALYNRALHRAEHISYMVAAVIMWWPAYSRIKEVPALPAFQRMVYLFILTLPMKALGAILTVSDDILYPYYSTQPRVFGLDPLEDQRLGGLIMWVPGGLVFWVTIGIIFFTTFYGLAQKERLGRHRLEPAEEPA